MELMKGGLVYQAALAVVMWIIHKISFQTWHDQIVKFAFIIWWALSNKKLYFDLNPGVELKKKNKQTKKQKQIQIQIHAQLQFLFEYGLKNR